MADANARNYLAQALMGAPAYNALAQFNEPMQPNALARGTLKPGPEPTGYDRLFDGIYGALGGTPDRRALAEALSGAVNVGTLGMATGAYDGAKELAQTGRPSALAMALMPGAKVVGRPMAVAGGAMENGYKRIAEEMMKAYDGRSLKLNKFGLRVDDAEYKPGDYIPNSRVWDDGVPLDEELDGTSTLGLPESFTIDDLADYIESIAGQYDGRNLYLLGAKYGGAGQDTGEMVLRGAESLGYWKKP